MINPAVAENFERHMRELTYNGFSVMRGFLPQQTVSELSIESALHRNNPLARRKEIAASIGYIIAQPRNLAEKIGRNGLRSIPQIAALGREFTDLVRANSLGWDVFKDYRATGAVINYMLPGEKLDEHFDPDFQSGLNIAACLNPGEFYVEGHGKIEQEAGDAIMLLQPDAAEQIKSRIMRRGVGSVSDIQGVGQRLHGVSNPFENTRTSVVLVNDTRLPSSYSELSVKVFRRLINR